MVENSAIAKPATDAEENAASAGVAKKRTTKGKLVVVIVAALAMAAAGGYFWLRPSAPTTAAASRPTAEETTLPLETFVVNLDGSGQRAYLRVGITLGLSHPTPHNKKEDAPIALVRDAILSVLSSAKPEPLLTAAGKEKLKTDLLQTLEERAPELGVENIYFTEFLVQM